MIERISGTSRERRPVRAVSKIEKTANDLHNRQPFSKTENIEDTVEISEEARIKLEEAQRIEEELRNENLREEES